MSEYGVEHFIDAHDRSYLKPVSVQTQRSLLMSTRDPLGFFGSYHSRQEQTVSDLLAQAGGRNGRVIGTIILNHNRFRLWYGKLIGEDSIYPIGDMLSRVEANGDQAALCIRLMGTERCQDSRMENGLYYFGRMRQRAARLLDCEIRYRGVPDFLSRYNLLNLPFNIDGAIDLTTLVFLQRYFYLRNLDISSRLSRQQFNDQLTIHISSQNVDLAGFIYDWEQSLPGPGYVNYSWPESPSSLFGIYSEASSLMAKRLLRLAINRLHDLPAEWLKPPGCLSL